MKEEEAREEDLDDLFLEIWERESKPELRFGVPGVGEVGTFAGISPRIRCLVHSSRSVAWHYEYQSGAT